MEKAKPKVIVVLGPTASGKSGVAIELAKNFNGEIISADSRQIYREMDIGTGKVKGQLIASSFQLSGNAKHTKNVYISEEVAHYLIDVVDPMTPYNVSHFKKDAENSIETIIKKGKLPIICGGSTFWIDALLHDTNFPAVKPNKELRDKLEKENVQKLFAELQKLDPQRAENIDPKNKVRLIRAIEIVNALGKVPSKSSITSNQSSKYEFLQIGIKTEKKELDKKIQKRLKERFDAGMIEEVEQLHSDGVSWEWMEQIGLEYRWLARYLQEKIPLGEMSIEDGFASGAKEKLYFDIIHYAKRQMTWLKRNKDIVWLKTLPEIEEFVRNFLKKQ